MFDAQYLVVYMVVVKITPKYFRNITTKRFKSTVCGRTRGFLFFLMVVVPLSGYLTVRSKVLSLSSIKAARVIPISSSGWRPKLKELTARNTCDALLLFYKHCIVKRPGRVLCSLFLSNRNDGEKINLEAISANY